MHIEIGLPQQAIQIYGQILISPLPIKGFQQSGILHIEIGFSQQAIWLRKIVHHKNMEQ